MTKMMQLTHQMCYLLAIICLQFVCQETVSAELIGTGEGTPISNLYDNLLQREYAGPVVFPNHQVERKAQRSPSLRLRFGRSDPDMLLNNLIEKRWFGDVNQKPIRSPSLRLRFGRRSDPTMPRHSSLDDLMQDEQDNLNNVDYNDAGLYDGYERVVRKPQRLRWGRSVPYETLTNIEADNERIDLYNTLMNSDKVRNMLLALRQYDEAHQGVNNADNGDDNEENFQREVRKPAPLRLRFGRSTGGLAIEPKKDEQVQSETAAKTQN